MCGSSRVVQQPTTQTQPQKPAVYMRNQWLDGLGINAEQRGRNSLRIDRTGAGAVAVPASAGLGIGVN